MASVLNQPNGRKAIQFARPNGKRSKVSLGKVSKSHAISFKARIEHLLSAQVTGCALPQDVAFWVRALPSVMHEKLARVGLVEARASNLLASWIDSWIEQKNGMVKGATILTYKRARNHLVECFGASRELQSITAGDADELLDWMRSKRKKKLAENTARKSISLAKQFFGSAVRSKLIETNPFDHLSGAVGTNPARQVYVSREDIAKVIDACPDAEWRLIVAMARFGGLRVPSELGKLRWADVNWADKRFRVHATKTEHHDHGGHRWVPIFPELEPYLLDAFDLADEGDDYVMPRSVPTGVQLGTQLKRIIHRAGVQVWPKVFNNLRASCETDLLDKHRKPHVVAAWLGHSVRVAEKHYLQVTESDFAEAVQNPVRHSTVTRVQGRSPAESVNRNASGKSRRNHDLPVIASGCRKMAVSSNGPYRT